MNLRAIDGGKTARAKTLAKSRILTCHCIPTGNRTLLDARTGVMVGPNNRVVHKGTKCYICSLCGKTVE